MTAGTALSDATGPLANGLADEYKHVRGASIALMSGLDAEDCLVQTCPEVSPTKWHIAHVTWFFERFCLLELDDSYRACNERYLELFNSYYQTVGNMHPRPLRGLLNRPLLREVVEYRERVDAAMLELIEKRGDEPGFRFLVTLGLNHEQQHQELMLTDIKHVFFTNPLGPAYREERARSCDAPTELRFIGQAKGRFAIGHTGESFCFDNETPRHDVLVEPHRLANRLITNAEYRMFIDAGAYRQPEHWLSDGWTHIKAESWTRPLYWSEDLEHEFTLAGWKDIDPQAPVCHVSFYEADAYARWAGCRLPFESEWELAAETVAVEGNTLDREQFHPRPASPDTTGLQQLFGDVWEWTASPYVAYPGFRTLAGSLGEYNGKFMANQMVVRGGSCVSWAKHLRPSYRSFFYPHDRWQFLGIRLATEGRE